MFGPENAHCQVKNTKFEKELCTLDAVTTFDQLKGQGVSSFQSLHMLDTKVLFCLSKNLSLQRQGLFFPIYVWPAVSSAHASTAAAAASS